jgi:protein O-mannosyl-transferase
MRRRRILTFSHQMKSLGKPVAYLFQRHTPAAALITIMLGSFIAYSNALPNSFHFDDLAGIVANPAIRSLRYVPSYFTNPATFAMGDTRDWRPVLQITYALNYAVAGLDPLGFRLFNLLCHTGTAFFVFLIVRALWNAVPAEQSSSLRIPATVPALISALLFTVHTVNTEAVDYIWSRSSVLAAFFYVAAFYCFLRGSFGAAPKTKRLPLISGIVFFSLGLATKATVVTLPAMLCVYELVFLHAGRQGPAKLFLLQRRRLKKYLPLAFVLAVYVLIRLALLPGMFTRFIGSSPPVHAANVITPSTYLFTQFRAWIFYWRLFLWPHPLSVDYTTFGWSSSLWDARVLASLAADLALLLLAWRWRYRHRIISFFIFWFFIALLPEATFIPLADAVVGYRAYLANVGPSVVMTVSGLVVWHAVAARTQAAPPRHPAIFSLGYIAPAAMVLVLLTVATIRRNRDWRDEVTLWTDVMRKHPANPRAYMGLGTQYLNQGDYENAARLFDRAVYYGPRMADTYALRGYLKTLRQRTADALADYNTAIKMDPRSPYAFAYRGDLYNRSGNIDNAIADFRTAIRLSPFYADAYFGLGMAYIGKNDLLKATAACAELVRIDDQDRRGYECLGALLTEQNRWPEAVKLYERATKRFPEDGQLWENLGRAYSKNGMVNAAARAFSQAERATRQVNGAVK